MFKSFLIKYAEIGVKGKNRFLFEDALVDNARRALDKVDGDFKVTKEYGRIYATAENDYDFDEVVDALKHVFGIVGICPMVQIEDNGFEDLANQVIKYIDENYEDKNFTFKVMARRARKNYPMESMEINAEMGGSRKYLAEGSSNPGIGKIWAYAGRNPLYFCRRPVGSDYSNILWTSRL